MSSMESRLRLPEQVGSLGSWGGGGWIAAAPSPAERRCAASIGQPARLPLSLPCEAYLKLTLDIRGLGLVPGKCHLLFSYAARVFTHAFNFSA